MPHSQCGTPVGARALQRLPLHLLHSQRVLGMTSPLPLPAPQLLQLLHRRRFQGDACGSHQGRPGSLLPAARTTFALSCVIHLVDATGPRQVATQLMFEATVRSLNLIVS